MYLYIHRRFCELLEISPASGRTCCGCRRLLSQSLRNQKILGQALFQQWKLSEGLSAFLPEEDTISMADRNPNSSLKNLPLHRHTHTLQTSLILPGIASANRYIAVSSPKSKAASPVICYYAVASETKRWRCPGNYYYHTTIKPF